MIQAINQNERTRAFLQFFIAFLLTIGVIVTAVYFDFKVPQKENEFLLEQSDAHDVAKADLRNFMMKANEVRLLNDSLDKKDANTTKLEIALTSRWLLLNDARKNGDTTYQNINAAMLDILMDLSSVKKKLRERTAELEKAKVFEEQLKECQRDLRAQQQMASIPGYR